MLILTTIVLAITAALAMLALTTVRRAVFGRPMLGRPVLGGTLLGGTLFRRPLLAPLAGLGLTASITGLRSALALLRLAGLLTRLSLLLAVLAPLAPVVALDEASHGLDHTVIMVGVLVVGFGQDAIAGRGRFTGQRLIFVEDLVGITADPNVGTAAIENLVSIGGAVGAVMLGLVMVSVATTAAAATTATAARPLTIVWSH